MKIVCTIEEFANLVPACNHSDCYDCALRDCFCELREQNPVLGEVDYWIQPFAADQTLIPSKTEEQKEE